MAKIALDRNKMFFKWQEKFEVNHLFFLKLNSFHLSTFSYKK